MYIFPEEIRKAYEAQPVAMVYDQLIEEYHLFKADEFYTDPLTKLPNLNYMLQFSDERVHALAEGMETEEQRRWRKGWRRRSRDSS